MIRKIEEGDLESVAQMEKICFTQPWSYGILEAGIYSPYDVYYVYEQEDKIWGYCNLRVLAGEGEIQRIAVLPQYRRMGIGRKMMEAMVSFAINENVTSISLEVRESNISARKLYESYGFQIGAVRKGYYHQPLEDAIIMWKTTFTS